MSSFALRPVFFLRGEKETRLVWKRRRDKRRAIGTSSFETRRFSFFVPHLIVDLSTYISTRSFGSRVPVPRISLRICCHAPSQSSGPFPFSSSLESSSAVRERQGSRQRDARENPVDTRGHDSSGYHAARRWTFGSPCFRDALRGTPESTYLTQRRVCGELSEQHGVCVRRGASLEIATRQRGTRSIERKAS